MINQSPFAVITAFLLFCCCATSVFGQDCNDPVLLCPQIFPDTVNTTEGFPTAVPANFCFAQAPNAVFYSFNTLNTALFSDIQYLDSTATLTLSLDSCSTDTLLGAGLSMAVFTATDVCNAVTYNAPISCTAEFDNSMSIDLEGLAPSTTYYIMVTGNFGAAPAVDPSECAFNLGVQGPAVTYNLEADPTQNIIINPGQTAMMGVNPDFEPYEWSGENLNSTTASSVEASPTEFGAYPYTVTTEIEGCDYQEEFTVILVPPISPFNVFTPNGDGFNDVWEIDRIENFQNAQIIVYSRWGAKVFQATNYRNNWDGDKLPAATYYYVIELNDPNNFDAPPISGSVTILR